MAWDTSLPLLNSVSQWFNVPSNVFIWYVNYAAFDIHTGCAINIYPSEKWRYLMTSFFLARGTKFWHARDAHVPLEYAKYKTFQCSSYATMTRTSRREGSWNKGRGFTDVRVIKQQNNHIKRSEMLQSDRCHCRQDYSVQEEAGTCEEGGRSCEEEDL